MIRKMQHIFLALVGGSLECKDLLLQLGSAQLLFCQGVLYLFGGFAGLQDGEEKVWETVRFWLKISVIYL